MRTSTALRSVALLERRAAAEVLRLQHALSVLGQSHRRLVEQVRIGRAAMLGQGLWSSFACHSLVTHATWGARALEAISVEERASLNEAKTAISERRYWARCRRGLERRSRRLQNAGSSDKTTCLV